MSKATATQVRKALSAAGIAFEMTGKGREWQLEVADESVIEAVRAALPGVGIGGFRTGYGSYILSQGYSPSRDDGYCLQAEELAIATA